ncbi:MAG TPA: hypothetical protein VM009_02290 [Terriglobales bacterium]|nr:hypothetical protein [Terriglobales bacterium]
MTTPLLVGKELACSFYVQSRHVMLVHGKKPFGAEVELTESGFDRGISSLTLTLNPIAPANSFETEPCAADQPHSDSYYLVRSVFAPGPMRRSIRLVHRAGQDLVPVQPLSCRRCHPVTGSSQSFCFDEAFEDALRQLPPLRNADKNQSLPLVDIVAMGAVYGGFSGFSRLFLRLEASSEFSSGASG